MKLQSHRHLICFCLFFLFNYSSFGSNQSVVISGNLPGYAIEKEVDLFLYTHYFRYLSQSEDAHYSSRVINGKFIIEFPVNSSFHYISLSFSDARFVKYNIDLFIIMPGDSIQLSVQENGMHFSGTGSGKYNCQAQLAKIKEMPMMTMEEVDAFGDIRNYIYLMSVKNTYDNLYYRKMNMLYQFSEEMEPIVFDRLELDLDIERLLSVFQSFDFYLNYPAETKERASQLKYYSKQLRFEDIKNVTNQNLPIYSRFYADWMLEKIRLDIRVQEYEPSSSQVDLEKILSVIENNFSGLLREKLLLNAFLRFPPTGESGERIIKSKAHWVTDPYFKKIILHVLNKVRGAPAFNFSLPNETGNMISLDSFENKVLVIDFWFTGCSFSKDAKKGLKEVKETLNDSNIVFISVNIDEDRNKWINSLKDSAYNIAGFTNLFTNGLGGEHPFLRQYDYQSVPKILIVDRDKKVFSVMPPRPGTPERNKAFAALLEETLKTR